MKTILYVFNAIYIPLVIILLIFKVDFFDLIMLQPLPVGFLIYSSNYYSRRLRNKEEITNADKLSYYLTVFSFFIILIVGMFNVLFN